MHHSITHALIGLAIMLPFAWLGYPILGAIIASGFYFTRELYQFYILGKTHNGRFDHEGWIPVVIVTFTLALIL